MNLYSRLRDRSAEGRPIRVGVIGAGKFGSMFLAQARTTPGIHVMAVADRAMVMRRGRKIGEAPATADNQQELVSWIVGARGSTTV